jgi:hypothetical protein
MAITGEEPVLPERQVSMPALSKVCPKAAPERTSAAMVVYSFFI